MANLKNIAEEFVENLIERIEYLDVVECAAENDVDPDELADQIARARIKVYWL